MIRSYRSDSQQALIDCTRLAFALYLDNIVPHIPDGLSPFLVIHLLVSSSFCVGGSMDFLSFRKVLEEVESHQVEHTLVAEDNQHARTAELAVCGRLH
jgi:hypothetical protein